MSSAPNQALCNEFELGIFIAFIAAGGTRNHNFVLVAASGTWFARNRYAGYSSPEQLAFDHAAARELAARGVAVPVPHATRDGATWWRDGENVWEVFPHRDGRHLHDGAAGDTAALATALARWHRAGTQLTARLAKGGVRGETDPERLFERAGQIEREASGTASIVESYRATLRGAAALLPDSAYHDLPHTLVHGDVQPANILIGADGEVSAFVDLDWCAWRPRLYDLGFALLICCARHDLPFEGGDIASLTQTPHLDAKLLGSFLDRYQSEAGSLSSAERAALRPQLLMTWCHARISGALKVPAKERDAFLRRPPNLDHERWLPELSGI